MTQMVAKFIALSPHQRRELMRRVTAADAKPQPVARIGRPARLPASAGQEALWVLWRLAPSGASYNVPRCYDLHGPLDPDALRVALNRLIERHESLRTVFVEDGRHVAQVLHSRLICPLSVLMVDSRSEALRLAAETAARPFDLSRGPLIRARLWSYGPDAHLLLLVLHHIIVDDGSTRVIEHDLGAFYRAAVGRGAPDLPALELQYADITSHQAAEDSTASLRYWQQRLAGAPRCELPLDRPRPPVMSGNGAMYEITLPTGERAIGRLAAATGVTPFVALASVFALVLSRLTGQTDVVFGTPLSGRTKPYTQHVVGYFLNTVALRVATEPGDTFDRVCGRTAEAVTGAFRHHGVQFREVARALGFRGEASRFPVFDTVFTYVVDTEAAGLVLADDLTVTTIPIAPGGTNFDLVATVVETPGGSSLVLRYRTDLYGEATIRRFAGTFVDVLNRASADPTAPLAPDSDVAGSLDGGSP
jgi:hypothetical protein